MITITLLALLAFLGSLVGLMLAKIAKEEIKPGKQYFTIARKVFLILLAITLLSHIWQNLNWILPFVIGVVIGKYLKKPYLYFGFSLVLAATVSMQLFFLAAVLVFLYGLPYGSVEKDVVKQIPHFVVPFILLALPTTVASNLTIGLALIAGTLILQR